MFESIIKFAEIYFPIVKIQKPFVSEIFFDTEPKVDAIFVLFDMGRPNDYSACDDQIGEEWKDLGRSGFLGNLLFIFAVLNHYIFINIFYLFSLLSWRLFLLDFKALLDYLPNFGIVSRSYYWAH